MIRNHHQDTRSALPALRRESVGKPQKSLAILYAQVSQRYHSQQEASKTEDRNAFQLARLLLVQNSGHLTAIPGHRMLSVLLGSSPRLLSPSSCSPSPPTPSPPHSGSTLMGPPPPFSPPQQDLASLSALPITSPW
ncbi:hypothetical protein PtB15_8B502 [Puccinia triticina]|nr:hypothetical protein PtB15_8B502 [Puccinia triticina]